MNKIQLQAGTLAPLVGVLAGVLAGRGAFGLDAASWTIVLGSLASIGAVGWGAFSTRALALKDTVGNMPQTLVVTDKATADALPANPNVVANTEVKVVPHA